MTTTPTLRLEPQSSAPAAIVILRESELDCDLTTAIQRIRANQETAQSRILVVAPDEAGESPETVAQDLDVPALPLIGQAARRGEQIALQPFGQRMLSLLTCMDRFLEESEWALRDLEEAIAEEPRARLLNQVKVLQEIQEWTESVASDMRMESKGAAEGLRWIESGSIWEEVAIQLEQVFPGIRVTVGRATSTAPCHARSADLAEAFYLALWLVAGRIGGQGSVQIEVSAQDLVTSHRVLGIGVAYPVRSRAAVERLRFLVSGVLGGMITPDELGPHGTGLTLRIPQRR